jgi:hypothetical protein
MGAGLAIEMANIEAYQEISKVNVKLPPLMIFDGRSAMSRSTWELLMSSVFLLVF